MVPALLPQVLTQYVSICARVLVHIILLCLSKCIPYIISVSISLYINACVQDKSKQREFVLVALCKHSFTRSTCVLMLFTTDMRRYSSALEFKIYCLFIIFWAAL